MESVKELDEAMSVFVSSHPHEMVMKAINMLLMVIKQVRSSSHSHSFTLLLSHAHTLTFSLHALSSIVPQVVENPHEAKFRRVRATEDSPFMRVMGGLEGMDDVMRAIRFKKEVNWWVLEASVHSWDIINACSYKLTSYKEMSEVPMQAAAGLEAAVNDPALVARLAEQLARMLPPGADAVPPTVNPFSLPGGPCEIDLAQQIQAILPDVMEPGVSRPSFEAFKNPHLMGMKPGGGTFDGLVAPGREMDVASHIAAIAANTVPADIGIAVNGHRQVRPIPRTDAVGAGARAADGPETNARSTKEADEGCEWQPAMGELD